MKERAVGVGAHLDLPSDLVWLIGPSTGLKSSGGVGQELLAIKTSSDSFVTPPAIRACRKERYLRAVSTCV